MRFLKKTTGLIILFLFAFLLFEFCVFLLVQLGFLNIIMPTYSLDNPERFLGERSYIYGHRHSPNSSYEIKKNCLHTYFNFNALGFRDELQTKKSSEKRVIVLGDSFMEGIGVAEQERVSDKLENRTAIPHLNFSMGDKGPTQSYVIYDSIASKYDHEAVILSLFPTNDYFDDDPNIAKTVNSIRPCWIGSYPNYQLAFVPEDAPSKKASSKWKHFLKRFTYSYDALYYLKESLKEQFGERVAYPKLDYFTYDQEQLNRFKYSIEMLKKKAGNRSIIVLCIPSHLDLMQEKSAKHSIEIPLAEFCAANDIEFIGLYDAFKQASENPETDFYYSCDSHWNAHGHQLAMEEVLSKSSFYQNGSYE